MKSGRLIRHIAALAVVLASATASHAEAPVIVEQSGRLRATVIPATGWCSSVVSANIHGDRQVLEKTGEEIQRFIGAVRAGILEDCPTAELIRLHAFARKDGIFLAYTSRESGWAIRVFPTSDAVSPVLQGRHTGAALSREFAYFETKTLFDRARLPGVHIDAVDSADDVDHVTWRMEGAYGATYLFSDRRRNYRSLSEFADAAAAVLVKQCVNDTAGTISDPENATIASNVVTRTFVCMRGQTSTRMGVIVKEVDTVTLTVVVSSKYQSLFKAMMAFLSDKDIVY